MDLYSAFVAEVVNAAYRKDVGFTEDQADRWAAIDPAWAVGGALMALVVPESQADRWAAINPAWMPKDKRAFMLVDTIMDELLLRGVEDDQKKKKLKICKEF